MRENQSYKTKNNIGERKIMKTKSLFISTIAMVVMLIVALSVGTFAWYTAQDQVNATEATVGAQVSSDTALGIGWTTAATAASVSLSSQTKVVRPMIPKAAPTDAEPEFNEAILKDGGNVIGTIQGAEPWTPYNGDPDNPIDKLYVNNLDIGVEVTVTPKVTIASADPDPDADNLKDLLRVALYVVNGSSYTHLGTWGSGTAYACDIETEGYGNGSPTQITDPENNHNFDLIASGSTGTTFDLKGKGTDGCNAQIAIYAWLEGTDLTSENMRYAAAEFAVNFSSEIKEETPTP
jgi:hypothetical protein